MSESAGIRPPVTKCPLSHAYQTSLQPLSPSGPPHGFGDNDLNPLLELPKDHRRSSQGTPTRGLPGVRGSPLAAMGRGKEEMDPLHTPPPSSRGCVVLGGWPLSMLNRVSGTKMEGSQGRRLKIRGCPGWGFSVVPPPPNLATVVVEDKPVAGAQQGVAVTALLQHLCG